MLICRNCGREIGLHVFPADKTSVWIHTHNNRITCSLVSFASAYPEEKEKRKDRVVFAFRRDPGGNIVSDEYIDDSSSPETSFTLPCEAFAAIIIDRETLGLSLLAPKKPRSWEK